MQNKVIYTEISDIYGVFEGHIKNFMRGGSCQYIFNTAHTFKWTEGPLSGYSGATITVSPSISWEDLQRYAEATNFTIYENNIANCTNIVEFDPSVHVVDRTFDNGDLSPVFEIVTENGMVRYIYIGNPGTNFVNGRKFTLIASEVTNIEHQLVTETDAGFMSPTDKQTLNALATSILTANQLAIAELAEATDASITANQLAIAELAEATMSTE